jgi:hypothetical protein
MKGFSGELKVLAFSGNGIKCSVSADAEPFWLPRSGNHVEWQKEPTVCETIHAIVPAWLANKHRQLGGEASDAKRDFARPPSQTASNSERDMTGTLSKNSRKVESNHADYTGSVLINGNKYWLNGWVKDSKDGKKFLSLSVRLAEDTGKPKPAAPMAVADDAITF